MNEIGARHREVIAGARGHGLMIGMEFADDHLGHEAAKDFVARQILISGTYINARVLRVQPPLVISQAQKNRF